MTAEQLRAFASRARVAGDVQWELGNRELACKYWAWQDAATARAYRLDADAAQVQAMRFDASANRLLADSAAYRA